MAVTIVSQPQSITTCYNPFYVVAQSNNTSLNEFKYVVDVYVNHSAFTASDYVARYKILPRPNNVYCIFSPARLLESYLSYDLGMQNLSGYGSSTSVNCVKQYYVSLGEEYNTGGTSQIFSALTNISGYTINGVVQYDELPGWTSVPYQHGSSSKKYLTNSPSTLTVRNASDKATLSFLSVIGGNNERFALINVVAISGGSRSWLMENVARTATTVNRLVCHYGTGPWNINRNFYGTGSSRNINVTTDLYYEFTIVDSLLNPVFETKRYNINQRCTKYETVRLMFLNRLGCWDYMNFDLVSRKNISSNKNKYTKLLDYNYTVGKRGSTILDSTNQETMTVNSDWITDSEAVWLEELLTSPEVYELRTNGDSIPVIIDTTSQEVQKTINDKLFNISFNYSYAFEVYSQRNS